MSKKIIQEDSAPSGMSGSDGCFAPEKMQGDKMLAQNSAPKSSSKYTMVPGIEPEEWVNGTPCFHLDKQDEYMSFAQGIKRFHRWMQHTESEKIRTFARANPAKDIMVSYGGNYTIIKRGKTQ